MPRTTASASSSLDVARAGATGRRRRASTPRTSRSCRCRRRCAGRAGRRRGCASGRPRAAGAGTWPRRTAPPRRGPGPRPAMRGSLRTRVAVINSSTGPLNWTTVVVAAADDEPRRSAASAASAPRRASTRHVPVMRRCEWMTRPPSNRMSRCLPTASTASTRRPASRSRPAVAAEARVRRLERVGDVAGEGAADAQRRVVDGVALRHRRARARSRAGRGGSPGR